jgi:hypothetical protein
LTWVVLGDCNADLLVRGDEVVPAFGQRERLVDEMRLTIGGSGGICAAGAAGLGLRVAMIGLLGDDLFGRFMRESLASRGVDVTAVRTHARCRPGSASTCSARTTGRSSPTREPSGAGTPAARWRSGAACGALPTRRAGGTDAQPDRQEAVAGAERVLGETMPAN